MLSHTVRSAAGLSANGVIIAFYHVKRSSYYSIYFLNIEDATRLHLRGKRRMSVENETPQEGRVTSHSEEAHAERAASANAKEQPVEYVTFKSKN